jgi:CO dehydrogenase maturation factor
MVMGRIKRGGTGCYCPEGALLQALMSHLLLQSKEVVIMDMEAGVEHLARGTAKAVDILIIVVEPGSRSIETARNIITLAGDLGLKHIGIVGNRVRGDQDRQYIMSQLSGMEFLGFIPYDPAVIDADQAHRLPIDASQKIADEASNIFQKLASISEVKR